MTAGDQFVRRDSAPPSLTIKPHSAGYDGEFYYRLALTPFTHEPTAYGITLDSPAYRQQRIGYPLLVRFFSWGRPALVPLAMIAVNYLALCLIGWFGGLYLKEIGGHALWGLSLALIAGFLAALTRDLTEIVEVCFLLAGFLCLRKGRALGAAFAFTFAVLTKEPALLAVMAVGLAEVVHRRERPRLARLTAVLIPAAVYLGWQLWLHRQWGSTTLVQGAGSNLVPPLVGILRQVALFPPVPHLGWYLEMVLIFGFSAAVLLSLRESTAPIHERWAWILYALLAVCLSEAVWISDWAFMRALSELFLFGTLLLLQSRARFPRTILMLAMVYWVVFAARVIV